MSCQWAVKPQKITVGDTLHLSCTGLNLENAEQYSVLDPQQKYKFKILSGKILEDQSLDLEFTSYVPGAHEFKDLKITNGQVEHSLGNLSFEVHSILQEMQPPPQQPYGPMGPFAISFPYIFLYLSIAVLALAIIGLFLFLWDRVKWRRVLEGLKEHDSAQTPENQFYQNIRKLQRANFEKAQVQELNSFWRLYLLRKYQIPAFDWSSSKTLKYLRKKDADLFRELGDEMKKIFSEFEKAQKDQNKISKMDMSLLLDHSRKLVDHIYQKSKRRV